MATLKVDVVSDVICPWCYLAHARFEKALGVLRSEPGLEALALERKWVPYLLMPKLDPRHGSIPKRRSYRRRFGGSDEKVDRMVQKMSGLFTAEGLVYELDGQIGSTLHAHRLAEWAADQGKQDELMVAMFRRYHTHGVSPVCGGAARAIGLRGGSVRSAGR